jgi:hypothetical protein
MKKKQYLHTEFLKFLIESEVLKRKEKVGVEKDKTELDEVLPDKEIEDDTEDELDADKVIEKLIQRQNKYKKEYEDILYGRKGK